MSPLPLPTTPIHLLTLPNNHHLIKRYYDSTSTSPNIFAIVLGVCIPAFFLAACCSIASGNKAKARKKRELEETIHRSVRLHSEIYRDEGGGRRELPDSVVAEIVRDVQRELGRVQPAVVRGGGGGDGSGRLVGGRDEGGIDRVRDGEGSGVQEPPPAYKPQDG